MNVLVAGDGTLLLPPRAARRGGLRRPAARRAGPAARRSTPRRCARAAAAGTAAELARHARLADGPRHRADRQHPGRRRGDRGRRPRRGGAPLPAGARAARRPGRAAQRSTSTSPSWSSTPPTALTRQRPTRAAPPRCSPSSSTGCPPTPRPPGGPGCWRPGPLPAPDRDRRGPARAISAARRSPCCPDGRPGCAPRCSTIHARVLAGDGRASRRRRSVGMEALALAEKLDLHELAVRGDHHPERAQEGRPRGGPARRPGRGRRPGGRGRARCSAELRARFLLGRSYQDWAEFDEAERVVPQRDRARRARPGIPWAPYAFEAALAARLDLADVAGRVGRGARADRRHRRAGRRRSRGRSWRPVRLLVRVGPRRATSAAGLGALRRSGQREGVRRHPRRRRSRSMPPGGAATRRRRSRLRRRASPCSSRIWHEWFSARIRLAALTLGAIAETRAHAVARPSGRRTSPRSTGCTRDGHTVLERTPTRRATGAPRAGPGSSGWTPRRCGCAGWRASTPRRRTRWSTAWREAEQLFADFGHVYELAAVRAGARRHPARHRRPGRRPRGRATRRREAAHALGAQPLLDELTRDRLGTPARGDAAVGRRSTAREAEILALVAEGRSNGEIGKQLFISAKTVSGPRLQHPRQARRRRPHRGRRDRAPPRAARLTRHALRPESACPGYGPCVAAGTASTGDDAAHHHRRTHDDTPKSRSATTT